jgi:DNA repair exonuclease SbcCD ATPase subunit
MQRTHRWIAVAAVLAAACGPPASAQTARSGASASAQVYEQLQQLASERTSLQAENEKLKSSLAQVQKDRDALKAAQQASDRRVQGAAAALAQSTSQREATERELAQYKARMEELIAKFRETIEKLRGAETEGATAKQSLAARERELQACVDHNLALYRLNDDVLTHFGRQGFWARLARSEPFTQIERVQNENLIDDYRARAQDQITPGAKPRASQPGPAPAASPAPPAAPSSTAH